MMFLVALIDMRRFPKGEADIFFIFIFFFSVEEMESERRGREGGAKF